MIGADAQKLAEPWEGKAPSPAGISCGQFGIFLCETDRTVVVKEALLALEKSCEGAGPNKAKQAGPARKRKNAKALKREKQRQDKKKSRSPSNDGRHGQARRARVKWARHAQPRRRRAGDKGGQEEGPTECGGGGNCVFHVLAAASCAWSLLGAADWRMEVRKAMESGMGQDAWDGKDHEGGQSCTWEEYTEEAARDGVKAGTAELLAFGQITGAFVAMHVGEGREREELVIHAGAKAERQVILVESCKSHVQWWRGEHAGGEGDRKSTR